MRDCDNNERKKIAEYVNIKHLLTTTIVCAFRYVSKKMLKMRPSLGSRRKFVKQLTLHVLSKQLKRKQEQTHIY